MSKTPLLMLLCTTIQQLESVLCVATCAIVYVGGDATLNVTLVLGLIVLPAASWQSAYAM
jgi:hypothetical protein